MLGDIGPCGRFMEPLGELTREQVVAAFREQAAALREAGADATTCIQAAIDAGADVVGANCGSGMSLDGYRRLADQLLTAAKGKPVILQANAGAPQWVDNRVTYHATPQVMADLARDLKNAGVAWIGGCCGTTPDHLAAMATAIKS